MLRGARSRDDHIAIVVGADSLVPSIKSGDSWNPPRTISPVERFHNLTKGV